MSTKDKEQDKALQQELKQPDQFIGFWTKVGEAAGKHQKALLGGAVGVLALIAISFGVRSFTDKRAAKDSIDFARIEKIATASLTPDATAPKPEAEPKPDDKVPHFKTADERLAAAVKEADAFIAAHGSSKLRDEASLMKASYLVSLGKPAEAIAIYKDLEGKLDKRLTFLAKDGLAVATEADGKLDEAIALYGALAEDAAKEGSATAGILWDQALFNKARLLARKGDAAEAKKIWKQILEKNPTTALKSEIDNRLAVLDVK